MYVYITKLKFLLLIIFCLIFTGFSPQNYPPKQFSAKVVGIKDGDTIVVLWENKAYTIRFLHIDCPEKKQDFGEKAKKALSNMIYGKNVQLEWKKKDRNKRLLGLIFLGNININKYMIENGLAWHYNKYSSEHIYAEAEMRARKKAINIWSVPNPVAPWDFRKHKKY